MKYIITIFLLIVACICSQGTAQEQNPIELAKAFPPDFFKDNDIAITQINWRLKQLEKNQNEHNKTVAGLVEQLETQRQNVRALAEELPIEIRYADEKVRAILIGECLRELLSTRLDVASNEATIAQLKQELEQEEMEDLEIDRLNKEKLSLQTQAIEMKLRIAQQEYEQNEALYKKAFKTRQEVERSKYRLQIAQYELAQAKLATEIQDASRASEFANRLIEARINMQPLIARAAAAERFLQLFSDSDETIAQITQLKRLQESQYESIQESLRRIRDLKDQISELTTLRDLTQSAAAVAEDKKAQKQDDDKD